MTYFHGRLIDHIHLRVTDFGPALVFYNAVLGALGHAASITTGRDWLECDELFIDQAPPGYIPSKLHLAFQANDREMVERAYHAALEAGGIDNGPPGLRDYHPGYYAAFVCDPHGNNIEFKLDERVTSRSAKSIEIRT